MLRASAQLDLRESPMRENHASEFRLRRPQPDLPSVRHVRGKLARSRDPRTAAFQNREIWNAAFQIREIWDATHYRLTRAGETRRENRNQRLPNGFG